MTDSVALAQQVLSADGEPFGTLSLAADLPCVTPQTSIADARRNYMRLAAQIHPDKLRRAFDQSTEAFQCLVKAFECFVDPKLRAKAAKLYAAANRTASRAQTIARKRESTTHAVTPIASDANDAHATAATAASADMQTSSPKLTDAASAAHSSSASDGRKRPVRRVNTTAAGKRSMKKTAPPTTTTTKGKTEDDKGEDADSFVVSDDDDEDDSRSSNDSTSYEEENDDNDDEEEEAWQRRAFGHAEDDPEPFVSNSRTPLGTARTALPTYTQTIIGCPHCRTRWEPDSRPQYSLFMGSWGKKVHCQLCLFVFGSATALHSCPHCETSFTYDASMYDHDTMVCQGCKAHVGFPYYPVNQRLIDTVAHEEWRIRQERARAKERECRARRRGHAGDAEGGWMSDRNGPCAASTGRMSRHAHAHGMHSDAPVPSASTESAEDRMTMLVGTCVVEEECPLCHQRVRSRHRRHVEECLRASEAGGADRTDAGRSKGGIKSGTTNSSKRSKRQSGATSSAVKPARAKLVSPETRPSALLGGPARRRVTTGTGKGVRERAKTKKSPMVTTNRAKQTNGAAKTTRKRRRRSDSDSDEESSCASVSDDDDDDESAINSCDHKDGDDDTSTCSSEE